MHHRQKNGSIADRSVGLPCPAGLLRFLCWSSRCIGIVGRLFPLPAVLCSFLPRRLHPLSILLSLSPKNEGKCVRDTKNFAAARGRKINRGIGAGVAYWYRFHPTFAMVFVNPSDTYSCRRTLARGAKIPPSGQQTAACIPSVVSYHAFFHTAVSVGGVVRKGQCEGSRERGLRV